MNRSIFPNIARRPTPRFSSHPFHFFFHLSFLPLALCLLTWPSNASVLGDLAASLQPGTWKELQTQGLTDGLIRVSPGNLMQYSDNAVWDPASRQFLQIGGAHAAPPNQKFLSYKESSNSWTTLPAQGWFCQTDGCVSHPYDHHAIDAVAGVMYYRMFGSAVVRKFQISTGAWTALSAMPDNIGCCGGLAYFPELGGLVAVGGGTVNFNRKSTQQWTRLSPSSGYSMGGYHNFAEYNPVHKVVIFGGGNGSSDIYKLDSAGRVTKMKNAPYSVAIPYSVQTVDPVSGDFIFIKNTNDRWSPMYAYDVASDAWRMLSGTSPLSIVDEGLAAAPVSTHGVVMVLAYATGNPKVYVYKHAQGSSVEARPDPVADGVVIRPSPNPVRGGCRIRINGNYEGAMIKIFNPGGQIAAAFYLMGKNEATWETSSVPNGIYLLEAKTRSGLLVKKILVQK